MRFFRKLLFNQRIYFLFFNCRQRKKEIFSLLVWNSLQHDPLIMFEDGSSKFLAEIVSASERKRVKRHRTMKSTQE